MARPLRVEFPGGLYHVTSRGDRREPIYLDDADREGWLELLGHVCERFDWSCYAYCLTGNHFHIVVQTAHANLSAGMRQLNGVYTQQHNRRHAKVGHVFQGRFKAVVVQRETYLLELSRYVVLNPVRAGMCAQPEDWPWSSYHAMLGAEAPAWLKSEWLLSQFGQSKASARRAYIDHVRAGVGLPSLWGELRHQVVLGDDAFADDIGAKIKAASAASTSRQTEVPRVQRQAGAPPLAHFVGMPERNEAIRQAYATRCYTMQAIADAFSLHYATISRVVAGRGEEGA